MKALYHIFYGDDLQVLICALLPLPVELSQGILLEFSLIMDMVFSAITGLVNQVIITELFLW